MEDDCRGCKKWEEHIYWSRFQTVQFFQILSGFYHDQLAIPKKFANNLREKLAGSVALKGPSGATWNVKLTTNGEELYLKHGWEEFVEEHSLQENDVLVFRYNGDSQFDVLMFDQQSYCEKESSYFIRKCEHTELTNGDKTKRNLTSDSHHEMTMDSSLEVLGSTQSKKPRKIGSLVQTYVNHDTRAKGEAMNQSKSKSGRSLLQLISNRRPVTEEEKGKALQMASVTVSSHSFMVTMRPAILYRGFQMIIPLDWARTYLPKKTCDLTLHVKDKTWQARCYHTGSSSVLRSRGFQNFVIENCLEEYDVCVFKLASRSDDIVIDVNIFRVVEDIILPSKSTDRGRHDLA